MTDVWLRNGWCCHGTRSSSSSAWEDQFVLQAQVHAGHKSCDSGAEEWLGRQQQLERVVFPRGTAQLIDPQPQGTVDTANLPFQVQGAISLDVSVQTWNNIWSKHSSLCYSEETRQPKSPPALTVNGSLFFDFFHVRLQDTSKQERSNENCAGESADADMFCNSNPL